MKQGSIGVKKTIYKWCVRENYIFETYVILMNKNEVNKEEMERETQGKNVSYF